MDYHIISTACGGIWFKAYQRWVPLSCSHPYHLEGQHDIGHGLYGRERFFGICHVGPPSSVPEPPGVEDGDVLGLQ